MDALVVVVEADEIEEREDREECVCLVRFFVERFSVRRRGMSNASQAPEATIGGYNTITLHYNHSYYCNLGLLYFLYIGTIYDSITRSVKHNDTLSYPLRR